MLGYTQQTPGDHVYDYIDVKGICNSDGNGLNENSVKQGLGGGSGSLNGLTSGEKINYFISLPSDINKFGIIQINTI